MALAAAPKKRPVRAIPQKVLRKAWAEGHTYYPPTRKNLYSKREKIAAKPIEEQTLDDLCDGDAIQVMNDLLAGKSPTYGEPMRESTRAWIETGVGVLSLNIRRLFGDEEENVELIDVGINNHSAPTERNAEMYRWTPYKAVDPIMQRAIVWEQTASMNGDSVTLQIVEDDQGRPALRIKGWGFRTHAEFVRAAKSVMKSMRHKVEHALNKFSSAYAAEEKWRFTSVADDRWHTAYESYGKADDHLPGDPLVLKAIVHRRPKAHFDETYDLWRAQGRDRVEHELGTHLISDEMLEELLGIEKWDKEGNPCVL